MSKLPIRTVAKPWGKDVLPAPFTAPAGERIGEIWFEPPPELPSLLVKYIFTSEKLSVQVHPDDAQAQASGETARTGYGGKEECWLVIDAEPGATLGVGFQHAIGAGISLIEIQQNSDITYRLYDYGRPRALHLDAGIAVSKGEPLDPALRRHVPQHGTVELARGRYFTAHRVEGEPDAALCTEYRGPLLVLPRIGHVMLDGAPLVPGDCASASGIDALTFDPAGQCIVVRPA